MGPLRRVKLVEVHSQLVCELCSGYFVDATTIIECLHTFCKSCIVRYLETSNYCPTCEALVHKTKPLLNIREDKTVQDIVYKLVPGLFHKEINRRHSFYVEHPEACGDRTEQKLKEPRHFFYVDDQISLSLEYLPPAYAKARKNGTPYAHLPSITNTSAKSINSVAEGEGWATPLPDSKSERSPGTGKEDQLEDKMSMKTVHKRYLKCPAAVQVSHLEKFVRLKYGLSPKHRIDIVHGGDHLDGDLTLLDVVYMYKWAEEAPLRLFYTVTIPRVTRKRHRINGTRAPSSEKGSSPPRKMPRGEGKMGGTEGGVPKCSVNKEGVEESQTQPQGAADSVNGNGTVDVNVEGGSEGGLGREGKMVIDEDEKMEVDEDSHLKSNQGSCSSTGTSQLPAGTCASENSSSSVVEVGTTQAPSAAQHANSSPAEAEPVEAQQPQQKVQKQNQKHQQSQGKDAQQAQQTEQKVHKQEQQQEQQQELQVKEEKRKPLQQDVKPPQVVKQQQQPQVMTQQKQQQVVKQQDLGKPQERDQEAKEQQQQVKQQVVKQQEVVKQQTAKQQEVIKQQVVKQQEVVKQQIAKQQEVVKQQIAKQQEVVKQQQQVVKHQVVKQEVVKQQPHVKQQQVLKGQQQQVVKGQQQQMVKGQQQQVVKPPGKPTKLQQQVVKQQQQQQQQQQQPVMKQQQQTVMKQQQQQSQNQQKLTLKAQQKQQVIKQDQDGMTPAGPKKPVQSDTNTTSATKPTGRLSSSGKVVSSSKSFPQPQTKSVPSTSPTSPAQQQQHGVSKQLPNGTVDSSSGGMVVVSKLEEGKAAAAAPPPGVGVKPTSDKVPPPIIPTRPRLGRPPNASRKLNAAMSVTSPGNAGSPRFVAPTPTQVSKSAVQPPPVRPPVRPPVMNAASPASPQTGTKAPSSSSITFSPTRGGAPLRGSGANRGTVCTSLNVQNRLSSISGSPSQLQNSKLVVKKIANAAGSKETTNRLGKPGISPPTSAAAGKSNAGSSSTVPEVVSSASPASRRPPVLSGIGIVASGSPLTQSSRPASSSPSPSPSTYPSPTSSTPSLTLSSSSPSCFTTSSSPSPASSHSSSHRTSAQHGTEQRLHTGAAAPANKSNPAPPQVQQQGPRLSSPAAGSTKMPPKSPGKGRNPANILSIAQSLANKQLQQRTVTSYTPLSMPPTVTPATSTPSPASKEGGSKNNALSHAPASTSTNNMIASAAVGTGTGTVSAANTNPPVSNIAAAGNVNVTATSVPVSNVTVNNVPVSVPTCLASQFVSMANPNLASMSTSPLSPTLAAYISAFGDPASIFHGPLQDAAVRSLISWGHAAARFRDMNLTNMGTGTPPTLMDQHNFHMQQRTDTAPMDLSPTTKAAPSTTPVVNGKNSSPSSKTTVAGKGQITTTKSSASLNRSHGAAASNAVKSNSSGPKSTNSINKNSPTISPPTPEVTITKLPNATLATSTPTTTTRTTNTSTNSTANSKNNSNSNNSGGNSSGNTYSSNSNTNNSRPVPGLVKMPAHTNTVSITKRPVSSNKYAVAKSPANPSIRQIPNPSLLRHHQSELRNNNTVNAKSAVVHSASNTNGPNKMWVGSQQTRGGAMLKAAGNMPLKETGPLPETSSILQIEHLTQSFDTSKGVSNRKYFDAR